MRPSRSKCRAGEAFVGFWKRSADKTPIETLKKRHKSIHIFQRRVSNRPRWDQLIRGRVEVRMSESLNSFICKTKDINWLACQHMLFWFQKDMTYHDPGVFFFGLPSQGGGIVRHAVVYQVAAARWTLGGQCQQRCVGLRRAAARQGEYRRRC